MEFFAEVSARRNAIEPHIPEVVRFERWEGRRVLEAGCGIGTDGARFAAAGAIYTGVDLSPSAYSLARERLRLERLPGAVVAASITDLPFPSQSFDLVFSHGVVHHIPDTDLAIAEFHRVLKPGGTALIMVYHRRSFNYYATILVLRRVAAVLLLVPGGTRLVSRITKEPEETLAGHRTLLSRWGRRYVLDRQLFLSHNTDGPGNPLSKVYSRAEAQRLMAGRFSDVRTSVRYLNLRLYPGGRCLEASAIGRWLARRIGWHLYLEARKDGANWPSDRRCG